MSETFLQAQSIHKKLRHLTATYIACLLLCTRPHTEEPDGDWRKSDKQSTANPWGSFDVDLSQ
jgi:hypothetical protein